MDAPPKMLKQHMEKHRELVRSTASLVMSQLGLAEPSAPRGEPLPVLRAFRDFWETERRQARRRTALLAAFFTALLLLLLGAGVAVTLTYVRGVQQDLRDVQQQAARFEEISAALKKETRSALADFDQQADRVRAEIDAKHRAILATGTTLESRVQADVERFDRLNALLAALESRQAKLQQNIDGLKQGWSGVTSSAWTAASVSADSLATRRQDAGPSPAGTPSASPVGAAIERAPSASTSRPSPPATILVSIAAPGWPAPVTCRLPLPE